MSKIPNNIRYYKLSTQSQLVIFLSLSFYASVLILRSFFFYSRKDIVMIFMHIN
jgi:hypothetical protein